jgi:hypothetical protein
MSEEPENLLCALFAADRQSESPGRVPRHSMNKTGATAQ